MTPLQKQLLKFNENIRLDYDSNAELREKRDVIVNKLKANNQLASFESFNQGSYAMHTGVEPKDKEYDIDVGLLFKVNKNEVDPLEIKCKVKEILEKHTDYGAEIKRPCVTVTYKKNGERAYHVDLAIYAYEDKEDPDSQLYLAKGKSKNSEDVGWEKSDPNGLKDYIGNIEDGAARAQFRRLVRYIKRWKNLNFSSGGHSEPPSIGLTLLLHDYQLYREDDDLTSMYCTVNLILNQFVYSSLADDGRRLYRLNCGMPPRLRFEPNTDIFAKMTDLQMTTFKDKLELLSENLYRAIKEEDSVKQCKILGRAFGDDFPLLDPADSYQVQKSFVPYSSSSGM